MTRAQARSRAAVTRELERDPYEQDFTLELDFHARTPGLPGRNERRPSAIKTAIISWLEQQL
jgi:hypothetical protein